MLSLQPEHSECAAAAAAGLPLLLLLPCYLAVTAAVLATMVFNLLLIVWQSRRLP